MPTQSSDLSSQLAALASAELSPSVTDFSWFTQELANGARYWDRRPTLSWVVDVVFTQLGVQAPATELESYIESHVPQFQNEAHNTRLPDLRKKFGEHIEQNATIRRAFGEFGAAFDDFHGSTYEDVILSAEALGYFIIGSAQRSQEQLDQDSGQRLAETA